MASLSERVRLADLRSGGFTHSLIGSAALYRVSQREHFMNTLAGHRDSVLCVRWSPVNPYLLATGSRDNTVRLWDVRRSAALAVMDQHRTEPDLPVETSASSVLEVTATAHDDVVNSVCFTADGLFLLSSGELIAVVARVRLRYDVVARHG